MGATLHLWQCGCLCCNNLLLNLSFSKGHMDKTKGEWNQGREVGMAEVEGVGGS